MTPQTTSRMFQLAALFNWIVGLGLLLAAGPFLQLIYITPAIGNPVWANITGLLVFAFGIGYYRASKNFAHNLGLIEIAAPAKLGVGLVALVNVVQGNVSWQIMLPAGADVVWGALFYAAMKSEQAPHLGPRN